jgi:NAD(P)-dependent dehydrogenase (short-subunit alcohol dehydrogenase family)
MASMPRLAGKVALISGAARGLGAAEARLFAQEGASVVLGDISDELGREVEAEIRAAGGEATYTHLDVTQEDQWRAAMALVIDRYGRLDILVNNAGTTNRFSIEEMTGEEWDRVMTVNLKSVFLGTKHAIPLMRSVGGGSIVNTSSAAGIVARPTNGGVYSASKGGVRLFTKTTAINHAVDGIRCNSVHPGPIANDFSVAYRVDPEVEQAQRRDRIPLGRLGTNEDVAYGVLYLASDESSFVTGSELVIDGGSTAM